MQFDLGGVVGTPRNYESINLKCDFTGTPNVLSFGTDSVIFVNEQREKILLHKMTVGATEGIPLTITCDSGQQLEYYVDLMEKTTYRDTEIECTVKKRFANESFFTQADGFTFDLGKAKGINYEIFDTPYAIIETNQVVKGLVMSVALYTMVQALADAIKEASNITAEFISAIGTDVSDAISAGIKLTAQIVYIVALVLAIKKMCEQLRELIFPKIRQFKASKVRDLILKSANYLGYTVESTLLDSIAPLTILPVPLIKGKQDILQYIENDLNFAFTKGFPSSQDTTPTLGDLVRAVETTFNAKTTVIDNVVRIERRDFQFNAYQNSIFPALNIQAKRQNEHELNTSESWRRAFVTYKVDFTDLHTANNFDPCDHEVSTEQSNILNPDLVSIKGLRQIPIPFSLASRKQELNWLEKRVKSFFEFVDALTSIFGNGTNFAGIIDARIGVTQVSQQFFSTTKLLWTVAGRQPANFLNYISAKNIWLNYHLIDTISNNSYKIFSNARTMLSSANFVDLQSCNFANINGVDNCEILTVDYNDWDKSAVISYKEPFNWAFNTNLITIND